MPRQDSVSDLWRGLRVAKLPVFGVLIHIFPFWRTRIAALVLIGLWFAVQLINGVGSITSVAQAQSGVAYLAHTGGFVAGLLLVKPSP